jgi:hypothetical protein
MNIIKSDIVAEKYDVLWSDISQVVNGAGPRPILILVSDCEKGSTADAQLQKMLDGATLKEEQYNLVRLADKQMIAWHQLREQLDPKIIFLIGVLPSQLGISALFSINAPNNFNDRLWLPTVSINELENSKELKLQLWNNGMKPVFKDKSFVTF